MIDAVTAFFDRFEAVWRMALAGDSVAPITAFYRFPYMVVTHGTTQFVETETESMSHLEALIGLYGRHCVADLSRSALVVEPLPDDAARVSTRWQLRATDGAALRDFAMLYTLAGEAGEWFIVVIDASGEADALAAAGWD